MCIYLLSIYLAIYLYMLQILDFKNEKTYPPGNYHVSHRKGKGKSSAEKCRLVYLSSQEGNISVLQKKNDWKKPWKKQQPAGWWLNQPIGNI